MPGTQRAFYEVSLLVRVFVKLISTLSETSTFSFMDQRNHQNGRGELCELSIYYIPGTGLGTLVLILTLSQMHLPGAMTSALRFLNCKVSTHQGCAELSTHREFRVCRHVF